MIRVNETVVRQQNNFWNSCIFHPTDAVEDPWGKRILDRMAKDGAIRTVRVYAMFEDIVYLDEQGEIAYDFRVSDLRLDYLVEKGYNILIAYGMIPQMLASDAKEQSNVSKNKTRYKGKMLYTSIPKDYQIWEDICREYTKHIVERYGEDTVSKWYLHCYNEPDIAPFFMRTVPYEQWDVRLKEYFKMYQGFVRGTTSISEKLCIGGPALAGNMDFFDGFLKLVKEHQVRLDYIAVHNYAGNGYNKVREKGFCTDHWFERHEEYMDFIRKNGFEDTPLVYDEWGMAAQGFYNVEECPEYIARETEVFAAYYAKLISEAIRRKENISQLMICLSGQHEMVTDFSGFRNFFTLNFFAKPIYSAHVMASKLHEGLVQAECDLEHVHVVPTRNENGEYAVLVSYSEPYFKDNLPEVQEKVVLPESLGNQTVTVYCIDKNHTNPFRLYERLGLTPDLTQEDIRLLREEGNLKPLCRVSSKEELTLDLTANCVYLIVTEKQ